MESEFSWPHFLNIEIIVVEKEDVKERWVVVASVLVLWIVSYNPQVVTPYGLYSEA
jgi:hypothetical protein